MKNKFCFNLIFLFLIFFLSSCSQLYINSVTVKNYYKGSITDFSVCKEMDSSGSSYKKTDFTFYDVSADLFEQGNHDFLEIYFSYKTKEYSVNEGKEGTAVVTTYSDNVWQIPFYEDSEGYFFYSNNVPCYVSTTTDTGTTTGLSMGFGKVRINSDDGINFTVYNSNQTESYNNSLNKVEISYPSYTFYLEEKK